MSTGLRRGLVKANMNSDILLQMTAIFLSNLDLNRVLARCMSWLNEFTWAYWSCKERKRGLQNEKLLPTARLELELAILELRSHYHYH